MEKIKKEELIKDECFMNKILNYYLIESNDSHIVKGILLSNYFGISIKKFQCSDVDFLIELNTYGYKKSNKDDFYKSLIKSLISFDIELDILDDKISEIPFIPQKIIPNPEGKDCNHCKWKNDHYSFCQNAMCPKGNDGNGFHAFESDGTL